MEKLTVPQPKSAQQVTAQCSGSSLFLTSEHQVQSCTALLQVLFQNE